MRVFSIVSRCQLLLQQGLKLFACGLVIRYIGQIELITQSHSSNNAVLYCNLFLDNLAINVPAHAN